MPDENLCKSRARRVRDLASRADPFTRKRLLALADRYEAAVAGPPDAAPHAVVTATTSEDGQRNHFTDGVKPK